MVRLNPQSAEAHNNLGKALDKQGQDAQAEQHLREALRLYPEYAEARYNLGVLLIHLGEHPEAAKHLGGVIQAKPKHVTALNNLAWIYATHPQDSLRDAAEAVRLAERACELTERKVPGCLDTLAAAYAEAGRFDDAVGTAKEAIQLAKANRQQEVAAEIQARLAFYQQGQPYREPIMSGR